MKKKIITTIVTVFLLASIIFVQTAFGAYYITSSGQTIGYNQSDSTYANYYSLRKVKITPAANNTGEQQQASDTTHLHSTYSSPLAHSPYNYVTVRNTRIYYNMPPTLNNIHYKVNYIKQAPQAMQTQPIQEQPELQQPEPQQPELQQPEPQQPEPQQPEQESPDISGYKLTEDELELIRLINEERTQRGIKPLAIDSELCRVARIKAEDMNKNGYFSHTSPTYGSPFQMMRDFGISYKSAAENIAKTYSVERANTGFMNSEGHRENMLNAGYTHVGVGISGNYYVEMFISK